MVVKDQREVIRAWPEWQHGYVICTRATMHEYQRIAVSVDFHEEGHAPNGRGCH
jgi:hypothetical protein